MNAPPPRPAGRLAGMINARDGLTPRAALAMAERRLDEIRGRCRAELERRLDLIAAFAARDPDARPSNEALGRLVRHAEAALTACGALERPLLGRALVLLCAHCDALRTARAWPPEALVPALGLVGLLRTRRLGDAEAERMLDGLARCLTLYEALAQHGNQGAADLPAAQSPAHQRKAAPPTA